MSKLLTSTAVALLFATPAFAVDLGARVDADIAPPAVGANVKSSAKVESHDHTVTSPDGATRVHTEQEHRSQVRSSDTRVGGDVDMTVDDEE